MAGLADTKGHLTKTYQYIVTGELAYGSATYENEYTYNGESYNPNIHSQYLRARYYSVVTASFLTEDSYLGNIREPLTLNRYNYCVSSYLNYVDPSGNKMVADFFQNIFNALGEGWQKFTSFLGELWDSDKNINWPLETLPPGNYVTPTPAPTPAPTPSGITDTSLPETQSPKPTVMTPMPSPSPSDYIGAAGESAIGNNKSDNCDVNVDNLTEEEKMFVSLIAAEAGAQGEIAWKAVAQIIINRYDNKRDGWKNATNISDIISDKVQFNGYDSNNYKLAYEYLNNRDGTNEKYDKMVVIILPIYHREEVFEDIKDAVLFYSPKSMEKDENNNPKVPQFALSNQVEEVFVEGIDSYDFRFFRYK